MELPLTKPKRQKNQTGSSRFSASLYAILIFFILVIIPATSLGLGINSDTDHDGLTDAEELTIYRTNPNNPDSDNDGYKDGLEVENNYDPNKSENDKLKKSIMVNLSRQTLAYALGPYEIATFKVSTGDNKHPTPKGIYSVMAKKPQVTYKGKNYYYPNTKWNLMFKKGSAGNYYIHGAYWHNKFGQRVSHGCVNVSYANMEGLYNWAQEGVEIIIE